jgi:cell wall-associated NlpC family hydrolase
LSERVTAVAAIAPMLFEPDVRTTQVSQLLRGHAADVVARQGFWLRVRSGDSYEGWIHQGYVASVPDGSAELTTGWDDARPLSLGCTVRDAAGSTRKLPLGALITDGEQRTSGLAMTLEERRQTFPATGDAITATAQTYFEGTSYEWGGVTPWGADCSGLVQSSFALHGVHTPRDAWMQSETGTPLGNDLSKLLPGDLLFFSDEPTMRITHVAISLGGTRVVHQALGRGGHAIDDLESAEEYTTILRQRFRCARRVLS